MRTKEWGADKFVGMIVRIREDGYELGVTVGFHTHDRDSVNDRWHFHLTAEFFFFGFEVRIGRDWVDSPEDTKDETDS